MILDQQLDQLVKGSCYRTCPSWAVLGGAVTGGRYWGGGGDRRGGFGGGGADWSCGIGGDAGTGGAVLGRRGGIEILKGTTVQ